MTEQDLAFWEDAAANATSGPWEAADPQNQRTREPVAVYGMGMEVADTQLVRDATFIAASRAAVPALVAEVRRLRAELAKSFTMQGAPVVLCRTEAA